jgi:hypothetical protein
LVEVSMSDCVVVSSTFAPEDLISWIRLAAAETCAKSFERQPAL